MSTASSRCSARIRGDIPRDLEGRGGDSCPTRLRGSELLLSTPCCIGRSRGGRIGCRGRVGACGRLRVWRPRPGCASVCEVGYRTRCFGRFVPFGATGRSVYTVLVGTSYLVQKIPLKRTFSDVAPTMFCPFNYTKSIST